MADSYQADLSDYVDCLDVEPWMLAESSIFDYWWC